MHLYLFRSPKDLHIYWIKYIVHLKQAAQLGRRCGTSVPRHWMLNCPLSIFRCEPFFSYFRLSFINIAELPKLNFFSICINDNLKEKKKMIRAVHQRHGARDLKAEMRSRNRRDQIKLSKHQKIYLSCHLKFQVTVHRSEASVYRGMLTETFYNKPKSQNGKLSRPH
jgi:hypothetical protein